MLQRLSGCTLLAAASLMAQQFHIDHVTVAGNNVEAMTKALSRLAGITAQYGGPHSNHATEMALASFPDGSYLELIAIQPKADPAALADFCLRSQLAGNLVASTLDLKLLVRARMQGAELPGECSLTRGWRAEFVLPHLQAILDGRRSLRIADPQGAAPLAYDDV